MRVSLCYVNRRGAGCIETVTDSAGLEEAMRRLCRRVLGAVAYDQGGSRVGEVWKSEDGMTWCYDISAFLRTEVRK